MWVLYLFCLLIIFFLYYDLFGFMFLLLLMLESVHFLLFVFRFIILQDTFFFLEMVLNLFVKHWSFISLLGRKNVDQHWQLFFVHLLNSYVISFSCTVFLWLFLKKTWHSLKFNIEYLSLFLSTFVKQSYSKVH